MSSDGCSLTVHGRIASVSSFPLGFNRDGRTVLSQQRWQGRWAGGTGSELSLLPSTFLPRPLTVVVLSSGSCSGDSEFLLTFLGKHKAKTYQEKETHEPHHRKRKHMDLTRAIPAPSVFSCCQYRSTWKSRGTCCALPPERQRNPRLPRDPAPSALPQSQQSSCKRYFFNFLHDITCILNNNELINYKKRNNQ